MTIACGEDERVPVCGEDERGVVAVEVALILN